MSRKISSYIQTDLGRMRQQNEDNFVWVQNLWSKPELSLIGVIDGVGGYSGGAEAALITKTTIENYLQNLSIGEPLQLLKEAVIAANNIIHEKRNSTPELSRMSCVLTVAVLDAEKEMMYVAHVGDSRGYIFRNGRLLKITKDHSLVGMKEDSGYLTEEEAMHHPRRNEITKMLGEINLDIENRDDYIDFIEHSFLPNDIALFCSDGLTDLVNQAQMIEILIQPDMLQQKVQYMIDKANELGGKDNITVALAQYSAKKSDQKKIYKRAIEIPVVDENQPEVVKKKTARKKKEWIILAVTMFAVGFLANWLGTQKLLNLEPPPISDTVYVYKDSASLTDSLRLKDTLINATDTIFKDSTRAAH
ncbi:MAG TPA: protein phosphatase 2C domain-containing protein [Niabella sp.]|jgi:serine/threonine protein phosphatase PrpC|nr:protein phosphatase 2C domain-containing protein [Chitinophagaceae bacterium]HRN49117.1 protein phosphatase 2C domain-containing protein [Niabella sp.]HRO84161.1 protein phosphatase 2C domain-containing protein [Niabella sp.]